MRMTEKEKQENMGRLLEHDGWKSSVDGWIIPGNLASPMPLDVAFKINRLFAELEDTGFPENELGR